ncbi:outer membrane lipoprotein carrier protein LolA [Muricauda sp. JGD-17]|uniref:Outer membrane lipoprotein carrier protein LolA n=1 Tax=Flagellimonas ochracea TaxID=2696472 RepID=A0A964T9P0_9FLAO|nr:outer membrane lipoprotein carrier protein LolA [Allomuricauda ochracea]NAY90799.1 outer membrane lipoprotein carrier protein LolA [Allomuricauda ochracea]
MIKKQILFILLFSIGLFSFAQSSSKAEALLDEVYNKVKGYDNIYIDFSSTLENTEADLKQETNGNVTLSGEKYLLNYFGAKQLYDGNKVYTVVPENEEVTIEDVNEDENNVSPSKMLTFYKTGHNYQWDILQNVGGRKIQYVKLIPIDSNTEIKSVLLGIDSQTKHIYKLIQTGNNGTKTTITVNSFKTNQPLSSGLFTFNEKKYEDEGYYIIRN